jgi:hypothetical protein
LLLLLPLLCFQVFLYFPHRDEGAICPGLDPFAARFPEMPERIFSPDQIHLFIINAVKGE